MGKKEEFGGFPRVVISKICVNGWQGGAAKECQEFQRPRGFYLYDQVAVWMVPLVELKQIPFSEFKFIDGNQLLKG